MLYLARGLVDRGHDCTIVCPPGSGIDTAARLAAIRVRNLFCAGDLDLPFAYRLTQYLQAERPDIVHCHSRRGADVLGGIAASFADVPAVVSRRVDNTEMRVMAAARFRPFAKIIAISETIARVLEENGVDPGRIVVIRSAVDTARFDAPGDRAAFCSEYGIPEDACIIAAAGQLIERKGHRYLLEAVAQIKALRPGIRLLVFGEGPLDTELRAQAAALGLGDVVQFPGFRDDLDDFMAAIDIFAHPVLAEGLGVVTLKAAAAGVPVVGFAAGGVPEAVIDGETGLLVTPGSVGEFAEALAGLIADPARRREMGAAGRERMRTEFAVETMVERHIALYDSILNG